MKLLIDGYYLDKPRGMGRYLQELLFAVARFAPEYYIISVMVPDDISNALLVLPERIDYIRKRRLPFPVWEQFSVPLTVLMQCPDVVHFPYNTMPVCMNLPFLRNIFYGARVVTVHDLIYMSSPGGNFYQGWGNRYRKFCVQLISKFKTCIITDSYFSAVEIKSLLNLTAEVVYIPVERTCPEQFGERSIVDKWISSKNYLLHIGGVSPHKNSKRCVEAFIAAKLEGWQLAVLGMPSDCPLAQEHAGNDAVKFPGWVSDHEMRTILGHADGVLFPSLMEGYGLPIVEAFASGKPLLTSDLPPMNELAADAAILVKPTSVSELTAGILKMVHDRPGSIALVEKGYSRMLDITSEKMAQKMFLVYGAMK
ncbi:glycosyltransferase family 4 protein [Janthinobacterium sp. MDT1-19]|uniref:glycosyltransferase family 4 protein n=1 Tax=Janthinobacterium sp. MDT1-19 TaxID=1259339 RepID=UPI003F1F51CF